MYSQAYNRMMPMQYSQYPSEVIQSQFQNSQFPMQESATCYSGGSTLTGISQMSSMYMANQKRKTITDEIANCLNQTIANILPSIAQQTAEVIYNAINPHLEKQEKEMNELQMQNEMLQKLLKSISSISQRQNCFDNLNLISNDLQKIDMQVENCHSVLQNKMAMENFNGELNEAKKEKVNQLKGKLEILKRLMAEEKAKIGEMNNNVNNTFCDLIGIKQQINQQVKNINLDLKYGKDLYIGLDHGVRGIQNLENTMNELFNKIDASESIEVSGENLDNKKKKNCSFTPGFRF